MKKLENIPKKEIFNVPDGYFDSLPGKILARISKENTARETSFVFRYKLQYALPAIVLIALGIFWFNLPDQTADVDSLLGSVQTEDLVAYLSDSDITTEDLLENVDFSSNDLEEIESEVYELNMDTEDINDVLGTTDLENI